MKSRRAIRKREGETHKGHGVERQFDFGYKKKKRKWERKNWRGFLKLRKSSVIKRWVDNDHYNHRILIDSVTFKIPVGWRLFQLMEFNDTKLDAITSCLITFSSGKFDLPQMALFCLHGMIHHKALQSAGFRAYIPRWKWTGLGVDPMSTNADFTPFTTMPKRKKPSEHH